MAWKAEWLDKSAPFPNQLRSLVVCNLSEWICRLRPTPARQHNPYTLFCDCSVCSPEPVCLWCDLYEQNHQSVELKILKQKMTHLRNEIRDYDFEGYRRFLWKYLSIYMVTLQNNIAQVIAPMIAWLPAYQRQFSMRRINPDEASFESITARYEYFIDCCMPAITLFHRHHHHYSLHLNYQ